MDYRGLALIIGGVGLSVFGFQQSALWGWGNAAIEVCIAAGVVLLVVFYLVELRTEVPLMNVRIFRNQTFLVENIILVISMMAFIPVFFFASTYGQISLAEKATTSSLLILYFFLGFVAAAQVGGRMLDRIGAKRPVVLGCALAAVGFFLWAGQVTGLRAGSQVIWIIVAGAGMGLMLGQANTDAINRASRFSYGEATGITQTVRNYGASLGFAILGTVLISRVPVLHHQLAGRPGRARPGGGGPGGQDRPVAGRQRQHREYPAVHPRRLRGSHQGRALRHGHRHGGGGRRGHLRPQARRPAGRRGGDRHRGDRGDQRPRAPRVSGLARGRLQLLGALLHRGSFLVSESLDALPVRIAGFPVFDRNGTTFMIASCF